MAGWLAIGWTRGDAGAHHPLKMKMQDERRSPGWSQESAIARRTFNSDGKTCLVRSDGTGLRTLEFAAPNQATWQPAGFFPDGRVLLAPGLDERGADHPRWLSIP